MKEFRFTVRNTEYYRKQGGEIVKTRTVVIALEDIESGEILPHPISHFIFYFYHRNSGSINTELAAAHAIVPFLNFVLKEVKEEKNEFINVKGISDLQEKHLNAYLDNCVKELDIKRSTVETKEDYLTKFYKYLWDFGILNNEPLFIPCSTIYKGEPKTVYKLNLTYKKRDCDGKFEKVKRKDIVPQSKSQNVKRQTIRIMYLREILLLAKQETPDIAFGLGLCSFGGLRLGELVNCSKNAVKPQNGSKYGEEGLIIEIRDRQKELFGRLLSTSKVQVKKQRDQSCLLDPLLIYLCRFHFESVLKKVNNKKNPNALLYDYDGNPMSAEVFDKRLLKLKNTYLGMLLATPGRYQDYLDFSETKWRSHIGRGIFTNMCIDCGYSIEQTSVLRGDNSTDAIKSYYDIITATYNIQKALALLAPENFDVIEDLNMPFYKKYWKDVISFGR